MTSTLAGKSPAPASKPAGLCEARFADRWLLAALFVAGAVARLWAINFRHFAWDEYQIVRGGYACINGLYYCFTGHLHPRITNWELVTIYGIFPKYLAMLPCLLASLLHNAYPARCSFAFSFPSCRTSRRCGWSIGSAD